MNRNKQKRKGYFVEANEIIDKLTNLLLDLEKSPQDMKIADEIYRDVHSLKGISEFMGIKQVVKLLYSLEDILTKVKSKKILIEEKHIDTFLKTLDSVKTIIDNLKKDKPTSQDLASRQQEIKISATTSGRKTKSKKKKTDRKTKKSKSTKIKQSQTEHLQPENSKQAHTDKQDYILKPLVLSDDLKDVLSDFLLESTEILEKLDEDFLQLEKSPEGDPELLNSVFRAAHTLKGISGFFNFDLITKVSHAAENVLNKLRKEELLLSTRIMDTLLDTFDLIKVLIEDIKNGQVREMDISDILKQLEEASQGQEAPADEKKESKLKKPEEKQKRQPPQPPGQEPVTEVQPSAEKESLQKRLKETIFKVEQTIRVDVDKIDKLLDWVGELVLGRNRLNQLAVNFFKKYKTEPLNKDMEQIIAQISLATSNLQNIVMKTRMIPISRVFNKYPRMVRDLSQNSGKKINLEISGETTEVDKSVAEQIGDPLVHLVRNCIDHGIESPEKRTSKGKPPNGTIRLDSYQEGNQIVIKVQDDGRGIDPELIKRKAIEKKIISESESRLLSLRDTFNLIFAPGFSTAEKVTNISGRGVGMDVVKTNVEKLSGIIDVESEIDVGTTIILKIPLTLAIIRTLLIKVSECVFAIPLSSIIEVIKIPKSSIRFIENYGTISYQESLLPIVRLCDIFNLQSQDLQDNVYVVVIGLAEKRCGFIINSFLDHREVVIKSLGMYLQNTKGISGATILGDGTVTLIVDVAGLFNLAFEKRQKVLENLEPSKERSC